MHPKMRIDTGHIARLPLDRFLPELPERYSLMAIGSVHNGRLLYLGGSRAPLMHDFARLAEGHACSVVRRANHLQGCGIATYLDWNT